MAEREVKIGGATFLRADGPDDTVLWGFALQGETVDVHEDDLERFDRLNGPAATEQPPLPAEVESDPDEDGGAEPPRSGRGSGLDAWVAYAEGVGIDIPEGASRDDVIALVDAQK